MRTKGEVYNLAVLRYERAALLPLINSSLSHHPGHSIPSYLVQEDKAI